MLYSGSVGRAERVVSVRRNSVQAISTGKQAQGWLLWLAVGLLAAFFLSRLLAIDAFPPFLDEMQHVQEAELSRAVSPFMYTGEGRLFTIWWYMLFQPDTAAPVWLARTATLLVLLPGYAAVLAVGRLAAGRWGMVFAGLAALLSTANFFFERMALADPISASAILVAFALAYRLSRRASAWDAALTGMALFVAVGAKATALPFLGIPVAAALTLYPAGRTLRENARWLVVALGSGLGLIGLLLLGLHLRGYALFGFIELYNAQATSPILARLVPNAQLFADWLGSYTGAGVMVLLVVALAGLALRRQFYFVLCFAGPALAYWANERQFTRYFVALAAILLAAGAVFLAREVRKRGSRVQLVCMVGLIAWGLVQWLPFAWTAYTAPERLPLSRYDYAEYVASDAAGFGLPEVRDLLLREGAGEVIGVLANCQALRFLMLGQVAVTCPTLNPNGQDVDAVAALLEEKRGTGAYVVYEALPYAPSSVPGVLVGTVERPGGRSALAVYRLAP